ncbi:MAG: hypothetical protein N7Q72_04155, partial [Spiroplasma sp. Tabriz.8]|nr:hypothetical protein [Spiroplasma sp. Tabriz.8]
LFSWKKLIIFLILKWYFYTYIQFITLMKSPFWCPQIYIYIYIYIYISLYYMLIDTFLIIF